MSLVAHSDIGEGADGDSLSIGDARSIPVALRQVTEHDEIGSAKVLERVDQLRERRRVERRVLRVGDLIESGKVHGVSAGERQSAKAEHPLGIAEVADEL